MTPQPLPTPAARPGPLSLRARTLLQISESGVRHGAQRGQPITIFGHDLNAAQALVRRGLGELNDKVFHATHEGLLHVRDHGSSAND